MGEDDPLERKRIGYGLTYQRQTIIAAVAMGAGVTNGNTKTIGHKAALQFEGTGLATRRWRETTVAKKVQRVLPAIGLIGSNQRMGGEISQAYSLVRGEPMALREQGMRPKFVEDNPCNVDG